MAQLELRFKTPMDLDLGDLGLPLEAKWALGHLERGKGVRGGLMSYHLHLLLGPPLLTIWN